MLILFCFFNMNNTFGQTVTNLSNLTFVGGSAPVIIDADISFTSGTHYGEGYLQFALTGGSTNDNFGTSSDANPNAAGAISFDAGVVYLGNGSGRDPIGSIDATFNGLNGADLRINFTSNFQNGSFEDGTLNGWTAMNQFIDLGATSIAGWPSPNDAGDNAAPASATFNSTIETDQYTDGTHSLRLISSMTTSNKCDIVHGPAVYSNVFQAAASDILKFDWRAFMGADAYSVYVYLLNANTGATIEIVNAKASGQTNWTTSQVNVPSTGSYQFVFVSGTWDETCGRAAGASLYIDNVIVSGSRVIDAVITNIARKITYHWTNGTSTDRGLTVSAKTTTGAVGNASSVITIKTAPILNACTATTIKPTKATLNSSVTSDGGEPITERGFYYGTSSTPTTNKTLVTGTVGSMTTEITGLTCRTTYYARSFATNSLGTSYGTEVSFTTPMAGDCDNDGVFTAGEIAGDLDCSGIIEGTEICGDIDGNGVITSPEIAGDVDGDGVITSPEIAGDVDGDGVITSPEIAGDVDGDGIINNGEIAGDINGDKIINNGEICGDIDGDKIINNGEIGGDASGNKVITAPEIAGDANGDGVIIAPEIAGDINCDGTINNGEIAGDINGDKIINNGEICGDINGDKIINNGEICGDVSGDKIINNSEICGDISGDKSITGTEVAGDINANRMIEAPEVCGDVNGDSVINNTEKLGDENGNFTLAAPDVLVPIIITNSTATIKTKICPEDNISCTNFDNTLVYQWKKGGSNITNQTAISYTVPALGDGIYTLKVRKASNGCENISANLDVQVYPLTAKPIIIEKKRPGNVSLLVADNHLNLYYNYLWTYSNNSSLPSGIVNNRQFLTLPAANMNDTYMVTASDVNGCWRCSESKTVTLNKMISTVYPSLNNGNFNINVMGPETGLLDVRIYNQMGTMLKMYQFDKQDVIESIPVSAENLNSGYYIIEILINDYKETHKIFIR